MAPKKQSTNNDLSKQLNTVADEIKDMNIVLLRHDNNLKQINKRHELADFGKKLLEEQAKKLEIDKYNKLRDGELTKRTDVWTKVLIVLGIVIAILTTIAATRGIKP